MVPTWDWLVAEGGRYLQSAGGGGSVLLEAFCQVLEPSGEFSLKSPKVLSLPAGDGANNFSWFRIQLCNHVLD
jgi:hypothetical protein